MRLGNIKQLKKDRGFTIVELLIVIVVIGILAAIVIVAYNGVQSRARDANNKTDAVSIAKVAEAVNADTGTYPTGATTAALLTTFDSSSTAKIPAGVSIIHGSGLPNITTAISNADSGRTYTVDPCGTAGAGLIVYYPSRATNTVLSQSAGVTSPCT